MADPTPSAIQPCRRTRGRHDWYRPAATGGTVGQPVATDAGLSGKAWIGSATPQDVAVAYGSAVRPPR